jgi:hypothetical protein
LFARQRKWPALQGAIARPDKAANIQSPCRAPNPEAVVHQQLDTRGARVGKHIAVMGLRRAEDAHHAGQQSIGARTHVDGLHRQPQPVQLNQGHPDHLSHSRNQAAHSPAHCTGQ